MNNPYAPPKSSPSTAPVRTQVAGRRCAACDKRIATAAEGMACVACDVAHHSRCLSTPDTCARCGRNMRALAASAAEHEAERDRQALSRGRVLVVSAIAPLALMEVVLVALAIARGTHGVADFVRIVLEGLLAWRLLSGSAAARRLTAVCCGLSLALYVVFLAGGGPSKAPYLGIGLLASTYALWVFALSSDAKAYLESRAPATA